MRYLASILIALFLLTACAKGGGVAPLKSVVYVPKNAYEVEVAIMKGAAVKGWSVQKIDLSTIQAKKIYKKQQLTVDIMFSSEDYTIYYRNSENMKYSAVTNTISNEYKDWIYDLDMAVQRELVKR